MKHERRVRLTLAAFVAAIALSAQLHERRRRCPCDWRDGRLTAESLRCHRPLQAPRRQNDGIDARDRHRSRRPQHLGLRAVRRRERRCRRRFERGALLKFDASGKLVKSFGAGMFVSPHGIHVDRQGNIWVADGAAEGCQGPSGFQVQSRGKGSDDAWQGGRRRGRPRYFQSAVRRPGRAERRHLRRRRSRRQYERPHREVLERRQVLKAWGRKGAGPGEFDTPHALAMDSSGRLFVADRGNSRIQIFDQNGMFLAEWKQFGRPSGIYIDRNDVLYAADTQSDEKTNPGYKRGIRVGSAKDGKVTAWIPDADPDGTGEGVAADANGNIYGALTSKQVLKKYVKR